VGDRVHVRPQRQRHRGGSCAGNLLFRRRRWQRGYAGGSDGDFRALQRRARLLRVAVRPWHFVPLLGRGDFARTMLVGEPSH